MGTQKGQAVVVESHNIQHTSRVLDNAVFVCRDEDVAVTVPGVFEKYLHPLKLEIRHGLLFWTSTRSDLSDLDKLLRGKSQAFKLLLYSEIRRLDGYSVESRFILISDGLG